MKVIKDNEELKSYIKNGSIDLNCSIKCDFNINVEANINAWDIKACDINAWNINARDIDAGDIIHQYVSDLNPKDGIHQNACRLVKNFSDSFPKLLNIKIKQKKNFLGTKHKTSGRIWTNKMWSPLHLKIIYDVYEDKINKYCLENKKIIKPIVKSILV